jgi:hypothetical protein
VGIVGSGFSTRCFRHTTSFGKPKHRVNRMKADVLEDAAAARAQAKMALRSRDRPLQFHSGRMYDARSTIFLLRGLPYADGFRVHL